MAFFFLCLTVHIHRLLCISDLLHSELDAPNLQDVTLLNLIVLLSEWVSNGEFGCTYDFIVSYLQTTHNKVHRFLLFLLSLGKVFWMVHVGRALQIKSVLIVIHDLEHCHIFRCSLSSVKLPLEASLAIPLAQDEFIAGAHN